MKSKIIVLVIFFLIASFIGCEKEKHSCATCSDTVTWGSFGGWTIQNEGMNGLSGGDNPINIVSDCGWEVLQDTALSGLKIYIVQSCDLGVLFYWIGQRFTLFSVMHGWTGSTKEGIKMGDDTTKFLNAYPYFRHLEYKPPAPKPNPNFVYLEHFDDAEGIFVGAAFFKMTGELVQLYVQGDMFKNSNGAKGEYPGLILSKDGKLISWYQNDYLKNYTKK